MRKIFITYKEIQNIRGTFNVNGICYSTIETLLTLLECLTLTLKPRRMCRVQIVGWLYKSWTASQASVDVQLPSGHRRSLDTIGASQQWDGCHQFSVCLGESQLQDTAKFTTNFRCISVEPF